jgi:competence protein ComEC
MSSVDNAPPETRALHDDDPGEFAGMDDGQEPQ